MKKIKAVIFDFGGVLSEEGFREGLKALGIRNRLNPDILFEIAEELIYQTGYITGISDESFFWNTVREKTGITESDGELRKEILDKFILRQKMLDHAERAKSAGMVTALLSDQTNWLDEIDEREPFFQYFDYLFNSFYIHKSKRDSSVFRDVCSVMGFKPEEVLFVDDNIENIKRAEKEGLRVIYFKNIDSFEKEMGKLILSDM